MSSDRPVNGGANGGRESAIDIDDEQTITPAARRRAARLARKARIWRNIRITVAAAMCLVSAAAGTIIGNIYYHSNAGRTIIPGVLWDGLVHGDPMRNYKIDVQMPANKQACVNLLMMGCDVDYENSRPVELKNSRGRSDSIMVARLDFTNNTVKVLSIPRDTAVHIPGHKVNKINAANALEGPELLEQTIKETFGIDTDFYVSINFDTFRKIVDNFGGVNLTVDKRLKYDDNWGNLHVDLYPGYQHLTGYQAMGYVRMRHSDDDLHRAARQHAFLEAMRDQVKSPKTFLRVPDVLNTLMGDIHSDLTMPQIIAIANWVRSVPKDRVEMETMPSIEGYSYVTVDTPKAEAVVKKLFFDNLVDVNINAPGMNVVQNLNGKGRKHKKGDKTKPGQLATSGTDEPLVPEDMPLPDGITPGDKPDGDKPPVKGTDKKPEDGGKGADGPVKKDPPTGKDANKTDGGTGNGKTAE